MEYKYIKLDKEIAQKCSEALSAGIGMNGSQYAGNKMAWVRMHIDKALLSEEKEL